MLASCAPSNTGVAIETPRFICSLRRTNRLVVELAHRLVAVVVRDQVLHRLAQRLDVAARLVGIDQLADLPAHAGAGPAEMRFQNLADIHAARHTQRVEHDVRMRAVLEERHVLDRNDLGDHALVAVTAGHLVAGLHLALHGHEDLDHLHDAGRHFVAALHLLDLVHEALLERLLGIVVLAAQCLEFALELLVLDGELPPLRTRIVAEHIPRKLGALLEALRPGNRLLARPACR